MYLLDTNVVSELRKVRAGKADARVTLWADSVDAVDLFLSAITLQELEIGVLLAERRDPKQGAMLRVWFERCVLPAFAGRVLPVDLAVARSSARLHVPDPRPLRDSFIAATALVHGLTVVTRDVGDFESTGVPILNPWLGDLTSTYQRFKPECPPSTSTATPPLRSNPKCGTSCCAS